MAVSLDDPKDVPDYGEHEIEHGHNNGLDDFHSESTPSTGYDDDDDTFGTHNGAGDRLPEDGGENGDQDKQKCDVKRCSSMFREATLSHDLSYDLSNDKIDSMCVTFNRAVECFNEFRRDCLANSSYYHHSKYTTIFDQISEGPLGLTMELCNNAKFRQDYLTLGPCQKRYRGRFDQCLRVNRPRRESNEAESSGESMESPSTPASGEVYPTAPPPFPAPPSYSKKELEIFIENCCALHYYHTCIYDISLHKCGKDAAEFSLKILELFNRGYLRDCEKYADLSSLCAKQGYVSLGWSVLCTPPSPLTLWLTVFLLEWWLF